MEKEFEVNDATIKPFWGGRKKHKYYFKELDYFYHMSFHMEGYFLHIATTDELSQSSDITNQSTHENSKYYFERLIDLRRPSESDAIKAYRRLIYLPLTQSPCFKVYNSLRKIVKASDWKIDYSKTKVAPGVADDETLEKYCEYNYPKFNSVENWWYNYGMKHMLVDANALIYVLPEKFDIEDNEYYKPIANIIYCKDVWDYKENEHVIFKLDREYTFANGNQQTKGQVLGIITRFGYWEARQIKQTPGFEIVEIMLFPQEMEEPPFWKIGGVPKKVEKDYTLWQSFMAPMLPGLDAMARESSDADAEMVQHVYSTMWYFSQQDCKVCMGTGKVNSKGKQSITCTVCNGLGNSPKSPNRDLVLKSGSFDQEKMPTPPAGYIQKNQDIIKVFAQRLEAHEITALKSINHEFLAYSPEKQSGIAKSMDRQELTAYTYAVAYHSVENVIDDVYWYINYFRYNQIVKNEQTLEQMLPKIAIPQNYDLLTESVIEAQIKSAKESNVDPEIVDAMQIEYVSKKFPNDEALRYKMKCIKQLDPFPGKTAQEKSDMMLAKTVTVEDVVLSNYIYQFIERATIENEDFYEWEYQKKIDLMNKYVEEKTSNMDKVAKLKMKQQQAIKPLTVMPSINSNGL